MTYLTGIGKPPKEVAVFTTPSPIEMMYYLYLPIGFPASPLLIPQRLERYWDFIEAALMDFGPTERDKYVYLTAKTMFVSPDSPGNRPGWHIDGFGSNGDVNYIWADMNPTEFAVQDFHKVSSDDRQSMIDIEAQIDPDKIVTYPDNTLLRLDESVVHRVAPTVKPGIRSFLKITVSDHQFRNEGNSINYLTNYDWSMTPRSTERNLDHG